MVYCTVESTIGVKAIIYGSFAITVQLSFYTDGFNAILRFLAMIKKKRSVFIPLYISLWIYGLAHLQIYILLLPGLGSGQDFTAES